MAIAAIRLNQLVETKARILDAARDAVALSGWKDAQIALICGAAPHVVEMLQRVRLAAGTAEPAAIFSFPPG